jgi:ABC-type multidrug transport system permease subunit
MEGIYMRVMRSLRSMIRLAIFNGYIPMRNNPLWVVSSFLSPFSFLWITVSFMVFLISTYIKSERLVWPLASILGLGLSVFPPVYYPVTILPEPVRWIAIIPSTASAFLLLQVYSGVLHVDHIYVCASIANLSIQMVISMIAFTIRVKSSSD